MSGGKIPVVLQRKLWYNRVTSQGGGPTLDTFDGIVLQDCPLCGGGILEEEGGWCVYVQCLDCGAHTAELSYRNEEERQDAARRVARNWNLGKVIHPGPGD